MSQQTLVRCVVSDYVTKTIIAFSYLPHMPRIGEILNYNGKGDYKIRNVIYSFLNTQAPYDTVHIIVDPLKYPLNDDLPRVTK